MIGLRPFGLLAPLGVFLSLHCSTVPTRADESMPPALMQRLKSSTVYVKTQMGPMIGTSGSGFVIKADGDSAIIVTNQHVVTKPKELQLGGHIPGLRGRDRITLMKLQSALASAQPVVSVIFNSGDAGEQELKAELLAESDDPDLAVLKVSGLKQKVTAIAYDKTPTLSETMSVYILGFPFGDALAAGKGNPAITVGKGSVSSIRKNSQGRISKVQIDGALNPGNSGGPVVDAQGNLAGIAVQTIQGSNIGLAIYPAELATLMSGSLGKLVVLQKDDAEGKPTFEIVARCNDPLKKLKGASIDFVAGAIPVDAANSQQPQIAKATGSQKVDLAINGRLAKATLPLASDANQPTEFTVQGSYVNQKGETVYMAPQVLKVKSSQVASTTTTTKDGASTTVTQVESTPGGGTFRRQVTITHGGKSNGSGKSAFSDAEPADEDKKPAKAKPVEVAKNDDKKADDKKMEEADDSDAKSEGDKAAVKKVAWTNSIKKMTGGIPKAEVTGTLDGAPFNPSKIEFKGRRLTMREGDDFFADKEVALVLFKDVGEVAGKKCIVNGRIRAGDPHVNVSIKQAGQKVPKSNGFLEYLLVLEFGKYDEDSGSLPGKIYLCFPDKGKSAIAGSFEARVDGAKANKPAAGSFVGGFTASDSPVSDSPNVENLFGLVTAAPISGSNQKAVQDVRENGNTGKVVGKLISVLFAPKPERVVISKELRELPDDNYRRTALKAYINGTIKPFTDKGFTLVDKSLPEIDNVDVSKRVFTRATLESPDHITVYLEMQTFFTKAGYNIVIVTQDKPTLEALSTWAKSVEETP